ncbi:glutaminase family protein [Mangrovihabitans endophyticus]|uniref:DUF5127 domain-containing protein n=1 Tax=Mangrovihabitans endophyticus TaxID=1751298 RepID=A0A8J3C6M1_9ACTN|nr:glutaminase family protein [Mangrovihabitans endophyticus]GGL13274.1 hypothetical protein GCM10012284_54960 [Mangrovihabitans endophyticus]
MTSAHPTRRRLLQLGTTAGAGLALSPVLPGGRPADAAPDPADTVPDPADAVPARGGAPIRPPAVPLAVRSPYLNTWLPADNLPGTWPTFWTGRVTAMTGLATVDGVPYLFMGSPSSPLDYPFPTMRQVALTVTATKSEFVLRQAGIELSVTFLSPITPGDLRRQSQPLSYVAISARSVDGRPHDVSAYLDISGEWASGDAGRSITWDQQTSDGVVSLSCRQSSPDVLAERGDTAEWGTVVLSSVARPGLTWQIGADGDVRRRIATEHTLAGTVDADKPRPINDRYPVFAFNQSLGTVTRHAGEPFVVSIGHLREPTVSYLGTRLPPLWRTYWPDGPGMIAEFHRDYPAAAARCATLDRTIERDATRAGGPRYAALCALAFRQAYAATDLVSRDGTPWAFLKEISSNGNMQTVDVTYPSMPVWLYADPAYLKLILAPVLDYAENRGFPKTFAPHDLGAHYPNADGHLSGEGEEDMPVEESANMLIMAAAYLARVPAAERRAYATAHDRIFRQWADYLVDNALDPEFQNQTDDFTGFIAHSVNLALKGIVGIGAMSLIAAAAGDAADSRRYRDTAREYIARWQRMALDPSGEHLKLAYDRDGTWSLKYNGYADAVLGLRLVPASVARLEADWYLRHVATDGIPLDIRHTYTKADWEMWTAAWLKDHTAVRDLLIDGLYRFADTSGQRVPMTDWYDVVANRQQGFQARPVVGGFFALLTL